jgi:predicted amidohydrolase YtcJ
LAAYSNFEEKRKGSLEGKWADFVLFDKDYENRREKFKNETVSTYVKA